MNKRKFLLIGSLIVLIITLSLLISGSAVLLIPVKFRTPIPLGTFITWMGMIALPLSVLLGIKRLRKPTGAFYTMLSVCLKIILILALLWVPISYILSGNFSFNFSNTPTFQGGALAMKLFWLLNYSIASGVLIILIVYWISLAFIKK